MEKEQKIKECNFCGSNDRLEKVPMADGYYYCFACREKFERQEEMVKEDREPQPYLE